MSPDGFCVECGAREVHKEEKTGDFLPKGTMQQCSKCKLVAYCGRQCQMKHWNDGHKFRCFLAHNLK